MSTRNEIQINLSDLDTDVTRNTREDYGDIEEFKSRIKAYGLQGLIQVRKNEGEGKPYLLEDGFRRITTIQQLLEDGVTHSDRGDDLTVIHAQVIDDSMSELERTELLLALNTSGKTWTPYEQAQQIKVLLDNGVEIPELEAKLGLKSLAIQQRLALLEAPAFLQEALAEGKISSSHARAILRIPNEELQEKLTKEAMDGEMATREIERRAEELVDVAVAQGAEAPRRRTKKEKDETASVPSEKKVRTVAVASNLRTEEEVLEELDAFRKELESVGDPITKAETSGYIAALEWVLNQAPTVEST